MAGVAGGTLAAEVYEAGGVGFIGGGHRPLDNLKEEVGKARDVLGLSDTDELPLGVGLILWRLESPCLNGPAAEIKAQGDLWLRYLLFVARVRYLWLSFSNRGTEGLEEWVQRVRETEQLGPRKELEKERERKERVRVMVMVQSEQAGKRARDWDVDAVVAQGTESGGHGPTSEAGSPLLPLLKSLAPLYPADSSPFLLAAGGLSSPSAISTALSSGASAAVVGTSFEVAEESLLPQPQKEFLVASTGGSTSRGIRWDIARDGANTWPEGVDGRALTNITSEEEEVDAAVAAERYKQAVQEKDVTRLVTWAGTGVGDVTSIRPAKDILRSLFPEGR
ncbi:hypothetical protein JCM11251_002294 [Rhodosporidiobolus azoricus]